MAFVNSLAVGLINRDVNPNTKCFISTRKLRQLFSVKPKITAHD